MSGIGFKHIDLPLGLGHILPCSLRNQRKLSARFRITHALYVHQMVNNVSSVAGTVHLAARVGCRCRLSKSHLILLDI